MAKSETHTYSTWFSKLAVSTGNKAWRVTVYQIYQLNGGICTWRSLGLA